MGRIMAKIKDVITNLARNAKEDVAKGQGRLNLAEEAVDETMALLEARRQTILLDTKQRKEQR